MDTWINGYSAPLLDTEQDIHNASGHIAEGITTLSFSRKRITQDPKVRRYFIVRVQETRNSWNSNTRIKSYQVQLHSLMII